MDPWSLPMDLLLYIHLNFLKTWPIKITAISLQQARRRVSMTANSPKIKDKIREKTERERDQEKERLAAIFCFPVYCGHAFQKSS